MWLRSLDDIGSGKFGSVYVCIDCEHPLSVYAVKCSPQTDDCVYNKAVVTLHEEFKILKALPPHKHIISHKGNALTSSDYLLFLELVTVGSMRSVLKLFGPMDAITVSCYTRQILSGLRHIHSFGLVHRDIKGYGPLWYTHNCHSESRVCVFCCLNVFTGETFYS